MKRLAIFAPVLLLSSCAGMSGPESGMSFFVTSAGGDANLGGLAGADRRCQTLASAAGAGGKNWHAYLSDSKGVNARDRIGRGPWVNAKGAVVAKNLDDLHDDPNINKQTALTEKGGIVNGRGDTPNMHDMLTGSQPDGRAFPAGKDTTCSDWTNGGEGSAFLGHADRMGLRDDAASRSWNSSHASRGCGHEALKATGGDGRFYCFAAN